VPARVAPLAVLLALLVTPTAAGASTVHVTTHADENNGCTPASCSLREAVASTPAGGTIAVPAGPFPLGSQIAITHAVTIQGAGRAATTVDAGGLGRVFFVTGGPVTIRGMTLTGGNGGGPSTYGGAILAETPARLTLDRVRLTKNAVTQASFAGSQGSDGGGGVASTGPLTVLGSSIDHNKVDMHADDNLQFVGGGGIYSSSDLVVRNSEVSDNVVIAGGSENSNSSVDHNGGGGIYVYPSGKLTLDRSTVGRNSASTTGNLNVNQNGGGGIYLETGSSTITSSTIAGNRGGAVTPNVDNGGGGIYLDAGTVALASTTVAGNTATAGAGSANAGGALYRYGGSATARNTIVAGNSADQASLSNCLGSISSQGHNIEDGDTCGLSGAGDQVSTPIKLGPLAFNGGITRTRAIFASGPAFNTGTGCPSTDQRGVPRPTGAGCDVGAFEIALPVAVTGAARKIGTTRAQLNGTVVPTGKPATYFFLYGQTKAYGGTTATKPTAGFAPQPARGAVKGLKPATIYHYRLVAKNSLGTARGRDRSFITHMKLPSGCVKDRKLTVPLGRPKGAKVVFASARVDKNSPIAKSGKDLKQLRLTGLPSKPFQLKIIAKLGSGQKVLGSRRYKPCG
jgi:CSLREA domain-containing protein